MDMWFWLLLTDFVVGAIAYYWGHWNGYGKGEADTEDWYQGKHRADHTQDNNDDW